MFDYNNPDARKRAKLYERFLLMNRKRAKKLTFRFLLLVGVLFAVWWPFIKRNTPKPRPLTEQTELETVKKIADSIIKAHTIITHENADSATSNYTGEEQPLN
jgi:hypothetical protein